MAKQNISKMAKANGIDPQMAYNRIQNGWTVSRATTTPRGGCKPKADAVWAYLVANPLARPAEVAKATGVSYAYAYKLLKKVGTPREVFEAEAAVTHLSLEQFVKDDTSSFPPRGILIGAAIVCVIVAWVVVA